MVRDRYRIEAMIGRGSFGTTYRAIDLERFDEPRVVKRLHSHLERIDRARELFAREARVLAAIDHPLIPRLHHFFIQDDQFHLVEDYVAGEPWDRVIKRRGPITEREACDVALDVLDALVYLHTRDPIIIHRDIKPSNLIRRAADGRTLLIDFGGVREVLDDDTTTVIGTPAFAPPEQEQGSPVATSDLYALGATLLQLVTGKSPHAWHDLITGKIRLDGRIPGSVAFGAVISRLFAPVSERYSSAAEARRDLLALKNSTDVPVLQVAEPAAAPASPPAVPDAPVEPAVASPLSATDATTLHLRNLNDTGAAHARPPAKELSGIPIRPRERNTASRPLRLTIASLAIVVVCSGVIYVYTKGQQGSPDVRDSAAIEKSRQADKIGPLRASVDTTLSGLVLTLSHPARWVVDAVVKSSPKALRFQSMDVYPAPGAMSVRLPDERGLFLINAEHIASGKTSTDEYVQGWAQRTFNGKVTADSAISTTGTGYQATLRGVNGGPVVGVVHVVITREPGNLFALSRCFLADTRAELDAVNIVLNSLQAH